MYYSFSILNQPKTRIKYFDLRLRFNDNRPNLLYKPIGQKKEFSGIIIMNY